MSVLICLFFYLSLLDLSSFQVCPSVFEVPDGYHRRGGSRHAPVSSNDEELLQYAIHQSLLESRRAPSQVRTPPSLLSSPFTQSFLSSVLSIGGVCVPAGSDLGGHRHRCHDQEPEWQVGTREEVVFFLSNFSWCVTRDFFFPTCHSRSLPEGAPVEYGDTSSPSSSMSASSPDTDLRLAMELSAQAQAEEEKMRKQEEEELERILQLSLTEK